MKNTSEHPKGIPLPMMAPGYMNQMQTMGKADDGRCTIARICGKAVGL